MRFAVLSVQYHALVVALMQLLISGPTENIWIHDHGSMKQPAAILCESEAKLETLMRLYYARHSFAAFNPWVVNAMTVIDNNAISALKAENDTAGNLIDHRSALVLAAKALESQSLNFYTATLCAVQLHGAARTQDLQMLRTYVRGAEHSLVNQATLAQHPSSRWPLPIIAINEDPEQHRLSVLTSTLRLD